MFSGKRGREIAYNHLSWKEWPSLTVRSVGCVVIDTWAVGRKGRGMEAKRGEGER